MGKEAILKVRTPRRRETVFYTEPVDSGEVATVRVRFHVNRNFFMSTVIFCEV
jgi:hypothetical protein